MPNYFCFMSPFVGNSRMLNSSFHLNCSQVFSQLFFSIVYMRNKKKVGAMDKYSDGDSSTGGNDNYYDPDSSFRVSIKPPDGYFQY